MSRRDDHLEIEVKLHVADLPAVIQRLEKVGAQLVKPRVFEHNVRYEDSATTLNERGIVVRLRQDDGVSFTYKEPTPQGEGDALVRFEAEVTVDDFDTMNVILEKLGYRPHIIYEKHRTTYALDNTEIMLDELPYGGFVEIEGEASDIEAVMDKLDLSDARRFRMNYIGLFEKVCSTLGLDLRDVTFENFDGIEVPPRVFDEIDEEA
jgi:adenylate cyclase class 2